MAFKNSNESVITTQAMLCPSLPLSLCACYFCNFSADFVIGFCAVRAVVWTRSVRACLYSWDQVLLVLVSMDYWFLLKLNPASTNSLYHAPLQLQVCSHFILKNIFFYLFLGYIYMYIDVGKKIEVCVCQVMDL